MLELWNTITQKDISANLVSHYIDWVRRVWCNNESEQIA